MIFQPRNTRQVNAKLFTGTAESGQEIVSWVQERGGRATYFEGYNEIPPAICIVGATDIETVYPDAYVYFFIGDPDMFYQDYKYSFENDYITTGVETE